MYQSIQNQINSNVAKTYIIIGIFIALISGVGYLVGQITGLGINSLYLSLGISLFMTFFSYFAGDKMVLAMHGAKEAKRSEFPEYFDLTHNLATRAGIPMPKLYIITSPGLNAFATGKSPESGIMCATTGILNKLDRDELGGVIAHELGHIKNYDIRLMTITSLLVGVLGAIINYFQFSSMFGGRSRENEDRNPIFGILGLFMIIFAPIIGTLLQLAISRSREFLADATSAHLTKNPRALIGALKKISVSPEEFKQASTATASMYISNPFKNQKVSSFFSTHPPIADRIKALEAMA